MLWLVFCLFCWLVVAQWYRCMQSYNILLVVVGFVLFLLGGCSSVVSVSVVFITCQVVVGFLLVLLVGCSSVV